VTLYPLIADWLSQAMKALGGDRKQVMFYLSGKYLKAEFSLMY
jgi:hypothetical protein